MSLSVYSFNSLHQVCERKEEVLNDTESEPDVVCVVLGQVREKSTLPREMINLKTGGSLSSPSQGSCGTRKSVHLFFFLFFIHSMIKSERKFDF